MFLRQVRDSIDESNFDTYSTWFSQTNGATDEALPSPDDEDDAIYMRRINKGKPHGSASTSTATSSSSSATMAT